MALTPEQVVDRIFAGTYSPGHRPQMPHFKRIPAPSYSMSADEFVAAKNRQADIENVARQEFAEAVINWDKRKAELEAQFITDAFESAGIPLDHPQREHIERIAREIAGDNGARYVRALILLRPLLGITHPST